MHLSASLIRSAYGGRHLLPKGEGIPLSQWERVSAEGSFIQINPHTKKLLPEGASGMTLRVARSTRRKITQFRGRRYEDQYYPVRATPGQS
jgi:hypothetical protein